MKLLTEKKQKEILKMLTSCYIIAYEDIPTEKIEDYDKMISNILDIAYSVGGQKGMDEVHNSSTMYIAGKNLHEQIQKNLKEMK